MNNPNKLPTIEHAGLLDDLTETPKYMLEEGADMQCRGYYSCSFCGVGDAGVLTSANVKIDCEIKPTEAAPAYHRGLSVSDSTLKELTPTSGCAKLKLSLMRQKAAFPIHTAPSLLDRETGQRKTISYEEAISRLADLLLAHRAPKNKTLLYACGQVDYFTIFAMQEVFRLLGIRNLTGNAEHCLNSGAVHNEVLTGQEGPFLTIEQSLNGPNRFYIFNGWNGSVTHPPVFRSIMKREDVDAFLIEVMESESASELSKKLGDERVLLVRPGSDPHLALAVAHEVLSHHTEAVEQRFIDSFAEQDSYEKYVGLVRSERFDPARVAERIAPEAKYVERLHKGIKLIALRLVQTDSVPINIPSMGLSQTTGIVTHCLWGSLLAMLGKYGIDAEGNPLGGTLRIAGQINAESEVQGLSRKYFMGRIPMTDAAEAAQRMGLPEDAYAQVLLDTPRAALDYADPTPEREELFLFFGTQFEANMMQRPKWIHKLQDPNTSMVVVDPIPDPFSEAYADLIIPSPPHPAVPKLYQNGEWKLSLSIPQKRAAAETRSDATIIYDVMAEIGHRLESDPALSARHPDIDRHLRSGYIRNRFMAPSEEVLAEDEPATRSKPLSRTTQATPDVHYIESLDGEQKNKRYDLDQEMSWIGRHSSCTVAIANKGASRYHAKITRTAEGYTIEDNSLNGTLLNGEEISGRVTLRDGDEIDICDDNYRYHAPEDDDATVLAMPAAEAGPLSAARGLRRVDGEVCRAQLWQRVLDYMSGGSGPLYCMPEHHDRQPIRWRELLDLGSITYGGVGTRRYRLDYDKPGQLPYADIYRRPRRFRFFVPTESDLSLVSGVVMNSGRSALSDDRARIQFATSSFNSGKATPVVSMPEQNFLHISPILAEQHSLKTGDYAKVTGRYSGEALRFPVIVSDRVKGESSYVSFHKSRAQLEEGHYVNSITSNEGRCPYTAQTTLKKTQILLQRIAPPSTKSSSQGSDIAGAGEVASQSLARHSLTAIDPRLTLPLWNGQNTPLYVQEIIRETHDVHTFRFHGDPLCRFAYLPGQFGTLVLNIDGRKVMRSYSISSSPTRPYLLEMTIKRVPGGLVSNWLPDNMKVGDRIEISGPRGKFCLMPGTIPKKILFLAAGSGVTPLMSMARWLCDMAADVDMKFFNVVRSPRDIVFKKELEYLADRYSNFTSTLMAGSRGESDDWNGLTGRISAAVVGMVAQDLHDRDIYMCGPGGFMDAAREVLKSLDFDMTRLHSESFGGVRASRTSTPAPVPTVNEEDHSQSTMVLRIEKEQPTGDLKVEFVAAGKSVQTDGKLSLLELAEENDIELDYGCRSGSCGDCKCKLIKGKVDAETNEALEPEEIEAGYILSCVARPLGDVVIDV